jgi:hypothetical protein
LFRNSSIVKSETNRQLLIKFNENGHVKPNINSMSTEYLINEQQNCSTTNELSSTNDSLSHLSQQTPTSSSSEQTTET